MTHIYAALVLILLVAIGCGVWRILKHTRFLASVVARNIAEADDDEEAPISVSVTRGLDDNEQDIRPIGFGVALRERN